MGAQGGSVPPPEAAPPAPGSAAAPSGSPLAAELPPPAPVGLVILLGAPGAGKGTQAQILALRLALPHIATGDIFRAAAAAGDELGRRLGETLRRGELLPDELVCEVVGARLRQPDCARGAILDGFPRTIAQADWLIAFWNRLERPGGPEPIVIYLTLGYNFLYRRLAGRRSCPYCGRIYNDSTRPPARAGFCDVDGTALVQRRDDDPQVVRERLIHFEEQTLPLVEHLRRRSCFQPIYGAAPVERVAENIARAVAGCAPAAAPTEAGE